MMMEGAKESAVKIKSICNVDSNVVLPALDVMLR